MADTCFSLGKQCQQAVDVEVQKTPDRKKRWMVSFLILYILSLCICANYSLAELNESINSCRIQVIKHV